MITMLFVLGKLNEIFFFVCFFLYYLSIKKCFWKGNRSKVRLFFLTLLTYPFTLYAITTSVIALSLRKLLGITSLTTFDSPNGVSRFVLFVLFSMSISTVIYVVLIILFSDLVAKWLNTPNKKLVTFVSLMYSVVSSVSLRGDLKLGGETWLVKTSINVLGNLILFVAAIFLYCFVIKALSSLTDRERTIDARLFVIPPMIFTLFYNGISMVMNTWVSKRNDDTGMFLIRFFSDVILFLFIWAFYVIIKNISATNEAIEAKELAAEMAVAEAKIEADLSIAKLIQTSALPSIFPPFPERKEFELFASMNAAKEVGGDFYDFYMLEEDTLGFLIADVSGKGIPAAMFMMTGKTIIKSLAENEQTPEEVFTITNEKLCDGNDAELFITAWLGYLDLATGVVHVANAGHNPPVLIRDGKADYVILKPGLMLAGMEGMVYKEQTLQMQKGDILYLYTDGVTEAMDADENQYGEDRLKELLSFGENYPEPSGENGIAGAICEIVAEDVERFVQGAEQSDDITMLCVRYLGES